MCGPVHVKLTGHLIMIYIPLTNTDKTFWIDNEDYPRIMAINTNWFLDQGRVPSVRSTRIIRNKCLVLARVVMNCQFQTFPYIDHIDGNALNNSKSNLRFTNFSGNGANRKAGKQSKSGIRGVSFDKKGRYWLATVYSYGNRYAKRFKENEKELAIIWYNNKAKEIHGEFAKLNETQS